MPRDLEREIKRKKPEAKRQKFPQIRKAFKQIVRSLARKHGQPAWLVENTIREKGLAYALEALEKAPPRRRLLDRLRDRLRAWFRK